MSVYRSRVALAALMRAVDIRTTWYAEEGVPEYLIARLRESEFACLGFITDTRSMARDMGNAMCNDWGPGLVRASLARRNPRR